jgi:hypothetical protein
VVLLERLVEGRKSVQLLVTGYRQHPETVCNLLAVVKEVVGEIVADVSEDAATVRSHSCMPIVEKYAMSQLPERRS